MNGYSDREALYDPEFAFICRSCSNRLSGFGAALVSSFLGAGAASAFGGNGLSTRSSPVPWVWVINPSGEVILATQLNVL